MHIRLWNVALNLKQVSTGKEKYPTRAFNVVVNHRKLVLAAQKGAYGSTNDKTLVRFDRGALALQAGTYDDIETNLKNKKGLDVKMKGCFFIVDNGYLPWPTLIEPSKTSRSDGESSWSKLIESLRKDVECFFGILKEILFILKFGCRIQKFNMLIILFFCLICRCTRLCRFHFYIFIF